MSAHEDSAHETALGRVIRINRGLSTRALAAAWAGCRQLTLIERGEGLAEVLAQLATSGIAIIEDEHIHARPRVARRQHCGRAACARVVHRARHRPKAPRSSDGHPRDGNRTEGVGAREPKAKMILRLAQGLEVPPGALLGELEVDGA